MVYKIIISQIAEESYFENLDFLHKNWTLKEVESFINKTEGIKKILENQPLAFHSWEYDANIRVVPIVEQVSLYYSVYNNFIEFLLFWNNYQDPKKLLEVL